MRLINKRIVITGATGIAAAGARQAASEGASVFVISIEPSECEDLVGGIGGAGYQAADLTDEDAAAEAFAMARSSLGGIDGVFAVAGGSGRRFGDGPLHEMSLEAWEKTFATNGDPAFLTAREGLRAMSGQGGSVVLVSSVLATRPVPALFATHGYAAAKGAIESLTTTLAAYYAGDGVRVNSIAPGLVDTPMSERAASDPTTVDYVTRKQPLAAGFLDPDDIASAAIFFLSDESSRITGQVLAVDGGWSVSEA